MAVGFGWGAGPGAGPGPGPALVAYVPGPEGRGGRDGAGQPGVPARGPGPGGAGVHRLPAQHEGGGFRPMGGQVPQEKAGAGTGTITVTRWLWACLGGCRPWHIGQNKLNPFTLRAFRDFYRIIAVMSVGFNHCPMGGHGCGEVLFAFGITGKNRFPGWKDKYRGVVSKMLARFHQFITYAKLFKLRIAQYVDDASIEKYQP